MEGRKKGQCGGRKRKITQIQTVGAGAEGQGGSKGIREHSGKQENKNANMQTQELSKIS